MGARALRERLIEALTHDEYSVALGDCLQNS